MTPLVDRVLLGSALLFCVSNVFAVDYGRTQGSFNVSGGAATYTIPIWTPPGPNGLTPSISLTYSSASGNGVGGVGWHISAVSAIERCARTIGQDGAAGGVELSSADRFCIGGNRLRLDSGIYGAANSVYFTEIADYSRITAYGTSGNGPQSFIVEAKSGLLYEYGGTTDSRVFPGVYPAISTTPARWMLNKVYDRNGNKYVISYATSGGIARPDVISWTPTSLGASTYRYEAKFNYSTSRTDADSLFGKVSGFDVVNRYRLENIQIKSSGVVKRKYRLAYHTSGITSRSRLDSAKECADDAETNCFLPISFGYQAGVAGVTAGSGAPPSGSSTNIIRGRYDFNGDGKHDVAYWSGNFWHAVLSTNSGFAGPYNTGATSLGVLIDDFLPSGRAALLESVGGILWTHRWDDSISSFVAQNTGVTAASPTASLDHNGDRLPDLVYFTSGSTSISVRANTSTGSGGASFSTSASTTATLTGSIAYATFQNPDPGGYSSDIDGDGREDVNVTIVTTGMGGGFTRTTLLYGSPTGFTVPPQVDWVNGSPPYGTTLNFNGDHCADRQIGGVGILISACSGMQADTVTIPSTPKLFLDWNGDGKTDVLVDNAGTLGVYESTGVGLSSLKSTSISSTGSFFSIDQDGDRIDDVIQPNGTSAFAYWTHTASGSVPAFATNIPDLLSGVTDGHGVNQTPNYVSTAWGSYDKGTTTSFPLKEPKPAIVVAQVTASNGIGGTYNRTFYYWGARENSERSVGVGFQRIDETDNRNGIIEKTYFEQTFPVSGMVSKHEVIQPNGVTPISQTIFTNTAAPLDTTANNQRYFRYASGITSTQYEVGSAWDGNLLRTVVTSNTYDKLSGALYDQTITTTEPSSGANGVTSGGSWVQRTYTPTTSLQNDISSWCLGRPGQIQRTKSHNLTYGSTTTRTTDITWNATLCRPTQTVEELGDGLLEVTTAVGYDSFGNVNSTTVTGVGMSARTTSTIYSDATFTTGQFPLSITNALSQTSTSAWNYDLGVPSNATDPNGITVSWQYDPFGRRIRENHPDSTYSTWDYVQCSGCYASSPMFVDKRELSSGGTIFGLEQYFLDQFDRSIYEYTRRLDGNYNVRLRTFDPLGRISTEYLPFQSPGGPVGVSTFSYDLANRATKVSRPISDSNSTLQYAYSYYEGLTTRTVDAEGKQAIKIANSLGELARSTDHDGYYQSFDYDAFGAPKRVMDSAGNTLQSSTYNLRGMLTARTDMDMGTWNFTPNALGETVSQTDAKSQSTTFVLDLLGRLTDRTEAEGTSTWTWGTSSSAKNIGRLASVSGPGYSESYVYDSIGRASTTTISADTSYQIDYSYNNLGALDTLTYPTSTSSYRLKLQYDYQYGHLHRIKDFNAPTTIFWTADAVNGRNQITQETLGNGLVTNRVFDAVTGWRKSTQTAVGGGTGVQNLGYEWDLVGNLKKRIDLNQSTLTEEFFYDNLHRLDYSTLNSVTNLDMAYDALGNITSKSGIGTYTYHASKKHQLTSTANGWSFGYDGNGNMTSGRGATIAWTSYNYPSSISNGSDTSTFSYTPDRQYWKQVSNYTSGGAATSIYVGGLLEKVTTSAGTDYRHTIRAGGASVIVSRQSSGTNSTHYVTSDHLGSSSAITNSAGAILVNSSFGAFGERRGSNWSGSPSSGDWAAIASTTRRGYTDHSMLDNLNLIHMNGRVQDPALGMFVSADPYIADPGFTQSYNRYSYVTNNPLSFTDPSGFSPDDPLSDEDDDQDGGDDGGDDEVTVTGYRDWDEGASSPEGGRNGPCITQFGGSRGSLACLLVTSQVGMGDAIAAGMAARHQYRQLPQGHGAGRQPMCSVDVNDPAYPSPSEVDFGFSRDGLGEMGMAFFNPDNAYRSRDLGYHARAQRLFMYGASNNHDLPNGFQHTYWHFLMGQQMTVRTAVQMGDAHEREVLTDLPDRLMDLYNNRFGAELGAQNPHATRLEAIRMLRRAIAMGCVRTDSFY